MTGAPSQRVGALGPCLLRVVEPSGGRSALPEAHAPVGHASGAAVDGGRGGAPGRAHGGLEVPPFTGETVLHGLQPLVVGWEGQPVGGQGLRGSNFDHLRHLHGYTPTGYNTEHRDGILTSPLTYSPPFVVGGSVPRLGGRRGPTERERRAARPRLF